MTIFPALSTVTRVIVTTVMMMKMARGRIWTIKTISLMVAMMGFLKQLGKA
jgi:hypothetical protein